jgi:hypothetical protein
MKFVDYAQKKGINVNWYALLLQSSSDSQKYSNSFWLKLYLLNDLLHLATLQKDEKSAIEAIQLYFE